MAFGDLNLPNHPSLTGLSGFLDTPLTGHRLAGNRDRCENLLPVLKRNIRDSTARPPKSTGTPPLPLFHLSACPLQVATVLPIDKQR